MRKIREVLRLREDCKLSHRQIARSCSISSSTVGDYLLRAKAASLPWPLPDHFTDIDLDRLLFPEQLLPPGKRPLPDFPTIHKELKKKGSTLAAEWERYKHENPDGYQYSQFCDLHRQWAKTVDVVMRQEHRAGEKLFSDFAGSKMYLTNPKTGEVTQAHLFVCALGASGFTYAEAFWSENAEAWCLGHARAFENYYFGVAEVIVPDNPRSVVKKPCRYEPDLHPDFQHMASHFGAAVIPARVRRPRDKGVVEAAVKLATRWIIHVLRRRDFFSLAELNVAIRELLEHLNDRKFKKMPESRRSLFEKLEKPVLKRLPKNRYEYVQIGYATVSSLDYHVRIDDHFYSVPYTLVKKKIEFRITQNTVEILHNGARVASHFRSIIAYGHTTMSAHMPESHQAYLEWTPQRVRDYAVRVGPNTTNIIELIMNEREYPQQAFRACLGIIRLSSKWGAQRLEAACDHALAANALSYKSVKLILEHAMDGKTKQQEKAPLKVVHNNLRGAAYYRTEKEIEHVDTCHDAESSHPQAEWNGSGVGIPNASA